MGHMECGEILALKYKKLLWYTRVKEQSAWLEPSCKIAIYIVQSWVLQDGWVVLTAATRLHLAQVSTKSVLLHLPHQQTPRRQHFKV